MPTPAYVLDLRRAYGQGRLLLPGVSAVIVRDDLGPRRTHVLLNRRSDSGRWSLPSGIVEPDEQPASALVREVAEETCVEVEVERLALLVTEPELTYDNGDCCQFISMTFRCRYRSGVAAVGDDESTAVDWFPVDDLPVDLGERYRRRIAVALADREACVFEL
ncbi:MAG TPA: NUDIX domain-containing protein [Propionibacteriaceae bacterium]|nr:NUDIX domain-containing protein [Propionibacteriaceae bacterium]